MVDLDNTTATNLRVDVMRSQLGRVRGLGAAHSHVNVWWHERVTSMALVPLTLWFIFSVVRLIGVPRAAVLDWAARPVNGVLLVLLVVFTFYHAALGLTVILEDYVHEEGAKFWSLLVTKTVVGLVGVASLLAALKIVLLHVAV